jgi:hypothetical protein
LAQIPAEAAVFTTNPYAPHLSQRQTLRVFVYADDINYLTDVDAAFLNLRDRRSVASELSCEEYGQWLEVAAESGFGLAFRRSAALVLRQGSGDPITPDLVARLTERCRALQSR